jgi:hypothetical protein
MSRNLLPSSVASLGITNYLIVSPLIYSYFQVNRPRGRGTAMLCPYDRCGSNT